MRNDMNKVITECYRVGDKTKYSRIRSRLKARDRNTDIVQESDDEGCDSDKKISGGKELLPMRSPYKRMGRGGKEFGENLGPLKKFLGSQVGKKWDDVWSEICQNLKSGKTIDDHVKEHIRWEVAIDTYMEDGTVFKKPSGLSIYQGKLYVHPVSGVLKRMPSTINKGTRFVITVPRAIAQSNVGLIKKTS